MKKRITLILSVLCLLALVVALASCGHEHAFKAEWASDATNHWHVCEVEGDECAEVSGKAAHTFAEKSKVEPTCTAVGELTEACSVCGFEKKSEIPMVAHDYADATCTAPKTCKNCPATDGEALGHDEQYDVVPPTCTEAGITNVSCSRCDYTATKDPTDALGHIGGKATCIALAVCTRCEQTYGELADHVYNTENAVEGVDYEITTAPTCVTKGVKTYKCTVCAALATNTDYIVAVDEIAHNYDVKGETTAPTCVTKGYTTYSCSAGACGTTENRDEVAEIDHSYTVAGDVVAPTCSAEGYTVYGCSAGACGLTENGDYTARTAHTFYDVNEFDIIRCAVCEQTYRNVTTIVTTGNGNLCLGCGEEQCVCNVNVEWNGYIKPSAPEQLAAGVAFTKNDVPEKEAALEIGGGLIKLVSESEANYTIVIGDNTITVSGTEVYVDLYKYESVKSVTITSDAAAQVVFYEILK